MHTAELRNALQETRRGKGGVSLVLMAFEIQQTLDRAEINGLIEHLQHDDCANCRLDLTPTLETDNNNNTMNSLTITIARVNANTYEGKFRSLSIFDTEDNEYRLQWSDLTKVFEGKKVEMETSFGKKYPQVKKMDFTS